jgi:uncharacterized integral membrane protein
VLVAPCAGACVPPSVVCAGVPLDGALALGGVVAEPVLVAAPFAPPDCEIEGGPATDTVLVAEPHPPRSAPAHPASTITGTEGRASLIVRMVFGAVGAPPRSRSDRVHAQASGTASAADPRHQTGRGERDRIGERCHPRRSARSMSQTQTQLPGQDEPKAHRSRRERARSAALIVLAVAITAFAVLNLGEVKVNWIVGSGKAPLIIVIAVALLVGVLLTHFAERRAGKHHH